MSMKQFGDGVFRREGTARWLKGIKNEEDLSSHFGLKTFTDADLQGQAIKKTMPEEPRAVLRGHNEIQYEAYRQAEW